MLKWQCNTSGILVSKTNCRARSLTRRIQSVDFELVFSKRVNRIWVKKIKYFWRIDLDFIFIFQQFNAIASIKPPNGQSWRQYMRFDKVDPCALARGVETNDYYKAFHDNYFKIFPGLPQKCPIVPGNYSMKNVTIVDETGDKSSNQDISSLYLTPKLPNGIYRNVIRMYNDDDPVGFSLYWHIENYDSMGDDRLWGDF